MPTHRTQCQDFWGNTAQKVGLENYDVWADLDGSNSLVARRVYGDQVDQPIARVDSNGTGWYHQDVRGSVVALSDASGTVQTQYTYDGFGNSTVTGSTSFADAYRYTARFFDNSTGLQSNRARWYDPQTGRWITQDPMGFGAGDANLYRYAGNRTTTSRDASGLKVGVTCPVSIYDQDFSRLLTEVLQEMENEGWRITVKRGQGMDFGAFGKELERRLFPRLQEIRESPGFFKRKVQVWFTDVWVNKKTGEILAIGERLTGTQHTADVVQIDAIAVKKGYTPRVGDVLDVDKIEDLYDLKSGLRGVDPKQRDKLTLLLNKGQRDGTRMVKIVCSPKSYDFAKHKIVDNPRFVDSARILTIVGVVLGLDAALSSAWAITNYRDYDDMFSIVIDEYRDARLERDPLQKKRSCLASTPQLAFAGRTGFEEFR